MDKDYLKLWYDLKSKVLDRPTHAVSKDAVLTLMAKMECDMYLDGEKKEEDTHSGEDEVIRGLEIALNNIGKLIEGQ